MRPEQDGEEAPPAPERNRSGGLRQKLKAYAVSAAAVVTAVSMAGAVVSPPPEWDYARIDRDLSDYHFAYYAQSPEEMETCLENEMWYRYFGKLGEEGNGQVWSLGEVILLESPWQVVISYYENGVERFGFVEVPPSGTPIGEQQFRCNFDISRREDGTPEADLRVFGNGVDIVGFFEKQLEGDEPYVLAHATNEHSNNACGNDLAYILRIQRSG